MKFFLLAALILTTCCTIQAQINHKQDTSAVSSNENDSIYAKPEITPCYPGGEFAWKRYIKVMLRYPDEAMEKGIQGEVTIQFIVGINGKVSNIKFINGNPLLADEGIRLIKKSGKWTPGVHGGRWVKAYKLQTISFQIE